MPPRGSAVGKGKGKRSNGPSGEENGRLPRLGELELAILEYLWTSGQATVRHTHRVIGKRRGISANTIGSAMKRLHQKHLVVRRKLSHAHHYEAALTRDESSLAESSTSS